LAIYKGGTANLELTSESGRVAVFALVVCFSIECFCTVVFRSRLAAGASTADRSNASSRQARGHQLLANYGPQPGTSLRELSPCFKPRLSEWPPSGFEDNIIPDASITHETSVLEGSLAMGFSGFTDRRVKQPQDHRRISVMPLSIGTL